MFGMWPVAEIRQTIIGQSKKIRQKGLNFVDFVIVVMVVATVLFLVSHIIMKRYEKV